MDICFFITGIVVMLPGIMPLIRPIKLDAKTLDKEKLFQEVANEKKNWLPTYLLGGIFLGAYYFAGLKYLWLILAILCFCSWILEFIRKMMNKYLAKQYDQMIALGKRIDDKFDEDGELSHLSKIIAEESSDFPSEIIDQIDSEEIVKEAKKRLRIEATINIALLCLWLYAWRGIF